jgi:glutathione S-transferase
MAFAAGGAPGQGGGGEDRRMTYTLAIGERAYSSWSLRGWLVFAAFGLEVKTVPVRLDHPEFLGDLAPFAPARTVPALRIEGVGVVWDTLAIAETVAERHPEIAFWPRDPVARMQARAMAAEMHSSFTGLRGGTTPMNLRASFLGLVPSEAVLKDLARIEALWSARCAGRGRGSSGSIRWPTPSSRRWRRGSRPTTCRSGRARQEYTAAHLAHPAFREWREAALADPRRVEADEVDLPMGPWPA